MQKALIQYRNPKNYDSVYKALSIADRTDLIGYGSKCLIKPKDKKVFKKTSNSYKKAKRRNINLKAKEM